VEHPCFNTFIGTRLRLICKIWPPGSFCLGNEFLLAERRIPGIIKIRQLAEACVLMRPGRAKDQRLE
jgi:hypothetical protein